MTYRKIGYLFLILLTAFLMSACSETDSPQPEDNNHDNVTKAIDAACNSVFTTSKLPGMIVGIWQPTKSYTYIKSFGYDDPVVKTPITLDNHFRIGSNTKSFTITVLLQLVDEGKLKLTDKIDTYFPDYPRAGDITVEQLCNMTSGIINYSDIEEFSINVLNNPLKYWSGDELIAFVADKGLYFEPGTAWHYANTNTVMIGRIIEIITGLSLEENLRTRIFIPNNLVNTSYPTNNLLPTNYVKGWTDNGDGNLVEMSQVYNISIAGAAGAVVSTLTDTKAWVETLVKGGLISDSLQQKRFTGFSVPEFGIDYKYGYGVFTALNLGYWGHNGSVPGYTSIMMHNKTTGGTIVIFYNCDMITPDNLFLQLIEILKQLN